MKGLVFTAVLICLSVAASAQVQVDEVLTSHGVRYRLTGVNDSYFVRPQFGLVTPYRPALDEEESLARCDSLVAAILARAAGDRKPPRFLRDRMVPQPGGGSWVDYSQRHQGHRIVSAGARLILDPLGRIESAGLQYEPKKLPIFKPLNVAGLHEIAERAVPYEITGPPFQADLMIDTQGDSPARLFYLVVFPIRAHGRDGGWQVRVNAVTGELIASETTAIHAG